MIHFKLSRFRLAGALALGLFLCPVSAQQPEPVDIIKIDSNLVSVPVIISDRQGHYVARLTAERFKLYDNALLQKIAFFENAEEPLNVALLLDTSRSTEGVIDHIKKAAQNFLKDSGAAGSSDDSQFRFCGASSFAADQRSQGSGESD